MLMKLTTGHPSNNVPKQDLQNNRLRSSEEGKHNIVKTLLYDMIFYILNTIYNNVVFGYSSERKGFNKLQSKNYIKQKSVVAKNSILCFKPLKYLPFSSCMHII